MDLSIDFRVSYHRIVSSPFLVDDGVFMKHHCIGFGLFISASLCLAMPNEHSHKPSEKERAGQRERPVSTFSIVAYDPDRQEWGVAVGAEKHSPRAGGARARDRGGGRR